MMADNELFEKGPELLKLPAERRDPRLRLLVAFGKPNQHADLLLGDRLRARRQWPCGCRTAEQRYERAPL
jgi:hypothetical protein